MPTVKVINAQGFNTLVVGLGIRWEEFPSAATVAARAQTRAAKVKAK